VSLMAGWRHKLQQLHLGVSVEASGQGMVGAEREEVMGLPTALDPSLIASSTSLSSG